MSDIDIPDHTDGNIHELCDIIKDLADAIRVFAPVNPLGTIMQTSADRLRYRCEDAAKALDAIQDRIESQYGTGRHKWDDDAE